MTSSYRGIWCYIYNKHICIFIGQCMKCLGDIELFVGFMPLQLSRYGMLKEYGLRSYANTIIITEIAKIEKYETEPIFFVLLAICACHYSTVLYAKATLTFHIFPAVILVENIIRFVQWWASPRYSKSSSSDKNCLFKAYLFRFPTNTIASQHR